MKKVIARLIVAGLILVALIFVLMNTVFKQDDSLKTHNQIANYLSNEGDLTKLCSFLQEPDVESEFKEINYLVLTQVYTLNHLYTKIVATKNNSDKSTKEMLKALKEFQNELKASLVKVDNIKHTKAEGQVRQKMIKDLKDVLTNSMISLVELNHLLVVYLTEYYYHNSYDASLALNTINVAYATNYLKESTTENYDKYSALMENNYINDSIINLSFNSDFNLLLYNCKFINLFNLLTDEEYVNSLDEINLLKAQQITNAIQLLA